jgi:hypothetical protein
LTSADSISIRISVRIFVEDTYACDIMADLSLGVKWGSKAGLFALEMSEIDLDSCSLFCSPFLGSESKTGPTGPKTAHIDLFSV